MLKEVKEFYESYPYPNLPIRTRKDLFNKMHVNVMNNILTTASLDSNNLQGKQILDAGCGTGEKACYFSLHGANAFALDISSSSLKIASKNAKKLKVKVHFMQADLLNMALKKKFDHIFSLGVLHHTRDPEKGFSNLASLLKKKGTITIGLYSKYGRFLHRIKRKFLELLNGKNTEKKLSWLARNLYRRDFASKHELAYVADKYANPHESYHSIEEVLHWFKKENIQLLGIYPKTAENFKRTQLTWFLEKKGFFIISGRKI